MTRTISYRMFDTLKKGKERLDREALDRVVAFVRSQQTADESFLNKSRQPDLYYTMFGWILMYVLDIRQDRSKMKAWLTALDVPERDLVHYAAWVRCRMIYRLRQWGKWELFFRYFASGDTNLRKLRRVPNDDPQSPYSQYILLSLQEDARMTKTSKETVLNTIAPYRTAEGGYANRVKASSATTNATVAALAIWGQLAGYDRNDDVVCLQQLQDPSGGFCATAESPVPDLLSTATALFMLQCYGTAPLYATGDFVEAHWLDNGGFAATLLDDASDVEYTFYGLLALGTL